MKRTLQERFASAATSARLIQDRTSGIAIETYLSDEDFRAKVERWLEKMGEALAQAHRQLPELETAIPELPAIIGARNRIAHDYDELDSDIIWRAASHFAPRLIPILDELAALSDQELIERYGG